MRVVVIAMIAAQLEGCVHARDRAIPLVVSGIAAMGVSLAALRRGPYGPGDYLMTAGLFAAVYGTAIYPHD